MENGRSRQYLFNNERHTEVTLLELVVNWRDGNNIDVQFTYTDIRLKITSLEPSYINITSQTVHWQIFCGEEHGAHLLSI